MNDNNTATNLGDDNYTLTGGGQMVELAFNSTEVAQMGLINVEVSSQCTANPLDGLAFLQITGVETEGFPELGTALLQFENTCNGKVSVMLATGAYVTANGSDISFNMVP